MQQNYSSRLLEEAVDEFATLPGIGKKDRPQAGIAPAETGG